MIKVGITERHGIPEEYANHPPEGVKYSFVNPNNRFINKVITSTAKGVWDYFDSSNIDIFEAPLFPILTKKNWIYTPAEFSGTANFGLAQVPLPKSLRLVAIQHLLKKDNFKKLIFKSHAGLTTLRTYGGGLADKLSDKTCVVYPAIGKRVNDLSRFEREPINLLFSGDFFRKGGANVVDCFMELSTMYPNLTLTLCCAKHLHTSNDKLREEYLNKIESHPRIKIGLVSRKVLLEEVLPNTDIFLSPTYKETFGFAILEALSFGIPTISTNIFAIPEIIDSEKDGILIDIKNDTFIVESKGYEVNELSDVFHNDMNDKLLVAINELIKNQDKRISLSSNAVVKCEKKFSPEIRACKMLEIYKDIY